MKKDDRAITPILDPYDGPHHRLARCGEDNETTMAVTRHSLAMDAMEIEGCWIMTLSGFGYWEVGGMRHVLDAGQVLALRKPARGDLVRTPKGLPWHYLWVHVGDGPALDLFSFIVSSFGLLHRLPADCAAVRKARELIRTVERKASLSPHEWSLKTFDFLNTWWQCAEEFCSHVGDALDSPTYDSKHFSRIPASLGMLANQMGYSRSYLSHKLKKQWNEPPGRVLRRARLEEAARLLRTTDLDVTDVAEKVGYQSSTAFIRAFGRAHGAPPLAYRHLHR